MTEFYADRYRSVFYFQPGEQLSLPLLNHFPLLRGAGEGTMTKVILEIAVVVLKMTALVTTMLKGAIMLMMMLSKMMLKSTMELMLVLLFQQ